MMDSTTKTWLEIIGLVLLVIVGICLIVYVTYWSFIVLSEYFNIPLRVIFAMFILYMLWVHGWKRTTTIKNEWKRTTTIKKNKGD